MKLSNAPSFVLQMRFIPQTCLTWYRTGVKTVLQIAGVRFFFQINRKKGKIYMAIGLVNTENDPVAVVIMYILFTPTQSIQYLQYDNVFHYQGKMY